MKRGHGKEFLKWCDDCETLLLGSTCDICASRGREFEVNSPGEIRPCMEGTREILIEIFQDKFGIDYPFLESLTFLNKVAGEDRTDEVIAGGMVIGVLRFDMAQKKHVFDLRLRGAMLLKGRVRNGMIALQGSGGHLKGKNLNGDRVADILGEFRKGDPVLIKVGSMLGSGVALADSTDIVADQRALRIRDIGKAVEIPPVKPSDRDIFVKANRNWLKQLEDQSVSDIRSFIRKNDRPLVVSFSGGKDSLAAFGVTMKATPDFELIFIDTGIEYPETVEYVKRFASDRGLVLHIADAGNAFWDQVGTFGPPAKDFRWCCKVCKLGPLADLTSRLYPHGTIAVEGNRMLESFARSKIGFVSRNPFVPNQIMLNPVRAWTGAEIWAYIWWKGLEYNPLYEKDFERIGCYLCASSLSSEWEQTRHTHPKLFREWEDRLHSWAEEKGLAPEYVDHGFWRWKVLPPKMVKLAQDLELRTEPSESHDIKVDMLKGASPCAAGGYSIEAVVSVPRRRDFSFIEDSLRTIGKVQYSSEFEIALLRNRLGTARLFGGGQVSVTARNAHDARILFERAVKALLRSQLCTECGICVKSCPQRCISIAGGMRTDERCTSCGKCESSCMVTHYYDKLGL